jgi:hypothetical protein
MWSNGAVADDPDDASPWARDDWVPDSAVPDENVFGDGPRSTASLPRAEEPPPEDFDAPVSDARTSGSTVIRRVVAAGVVIALLVGSAGALLRNDGSPETPPEPSPAPSDVVVSVPSTSAADTIAPISENVVTVPMSPELVDPVEVPGVPPIVSFSK